MRLSEKTNSVTIANADPRFKFRAKKLTQLVHSVLKKIGYRGVTLSLVFVTDSEIKRLNKRHLNHSWVTDVLAFPHFRRRTSSSSRTLSEKNVKFFPKSARARARGEVLAQEARSAFSNSTGAPSSFLGEVIISPKRAKIYSERFGIPYEEELVRYVCHGILHLKGYSDHSKKVRQIMERKENSLIRSVKRLTKGLFRYGH